MKKRSGWSALLLLVTLVFGLWLFAFAVPAGNFWIKISVSAAVLASLSLISRKEILSSLRFNIRSLVIGISAAVTLYLIFVIGRVVSLQLFSFAGVQIGDIYTKGAGTSPWIISILLFLIIGPSEEIFWRGFLQKGLQERLGDWKGYLLATSLYAGVHICSMNFMLVGAAAVAGAFWGAFYWRTDNLAAAVISHSLWSTTIFALLPLP